MTPRQRVVHLTLSALTAALVAAVVAWGQGTMQNSGGSAAVPSGTSVLITSGSCPSGFAEDTTARGRFIVGTPAAGTVGGTLGSAATDLADASYTPSGSNSSVAMVNSGSTSLGAASGSAVGVTINGGQLQIGSANAPSSTIPAEAFTGTANATMRSTVSPYLQVVLCKKS